MRGSSYRGDCCVVILTPGNATEQGMKHYRIYIWSMFIVMLVTYIIGSIFALTFQCGAIAMCFSVFGIVFAIIQTPKCKTLGILLRNCPRYAHTLQKYTIANWVLASISFITAIVSSPTFIAGNYTDYVSCFVESVYTLKMNNDKIYSLVNEKYNTSYYDYENTRYCGSFVAGFWSCVSSCIASLGQLILMVCYLSLQTEVPSEMNGTSEDTAILCGKQNDNYIYGAGGIGDENKPGYHDSNHGNRNKEQINMYNGNVGVSSNQTVRMMSSVQEL